jgi:alpha-galactosidase
MGWVALPFLNPAYDYTYISANAEALVSLGFLSAGYNEVNIDSGWSAVSRTAVGDNLQPNSMFPSMPGTMAYLTALGFRPGLYTDSWVFQCIADGLGSKDHFAQDAATMIGWGAKTIKLDSCTGIDGGPQYGYTLFSNGIWAAAHDIEFYICQSYIQPSNAYQWGDAVGHYWNINTDVGDNYASCLAHFRDCALNYTYSKPGGWNYPGELLAGNGAQTDTQYAAQMMEWCALPVPLQIVRAAGIVGMDAASQATLKNWEAIAINKNWGGSSLRLIEGYPDGAETWSRPLAGGKWVVLMTNPNASTASVTVNFSNLPSASFSSGTKLKVRDSWRHIDSGLYIGSYTKTLAATSAELLTISLANTSNSRHLRDSLKLRMK